MREGPRSAILMGWQVLRSPGEYRERCWRHLDRGFCGAPLARDAMDEVLGGIIAAAGRSGKGFWGSCLAMLLGAGKGGGLRERPATVGDRVGYAGWCSVGDISLLPGHEMGAEETFLDRENSVLFRDLAALIRGRFGGPYPLRSLASSPGPLSIADGEGGRRVFRAGCVPWPFR